MATKPECTAGKYYGNFVVRVLSKRERAIRIPSTCTGSYDVYFEAKTGIVTAVPKGERIEPPGNTTAHLTSVPKGERIEPEAVKP